MPFFHGSTALVGIGLPYEFPPSHPYTPHPEGLLWTSDRPWQHITGQETDIHAPGGIRTRSSSNRAVADTYFEPRGHRNRPQNSSSVILCYCYFVSFGPNTVCSCTRSIPLCYAMKCLHRVTLKMSLPTKSLNISRNIQHFAIINLQATVNYLTRQTEGVAWIAVATSVSLNKLLHYNVGIS
jgi:hypothetical protein